jgi:hypothetical protein
MTARSVSEKQEHAVSRPAPPVTDSPISKITARAARLLGGRPPLLGRAPRIGIDFDNTIVSYDEAMYRAAVDRGLLGAGAERSKRAVRDSIRQLPNGELEWTKMQGLVYGPLMEQARLIDGVPEFIRRCSDAGLAVYIISHKTEYASYDDTRTNLRIAALEWMAAQRFFEPDGLGLSRGAVYFESTRAEKIARIRSVGCSHFIDDLEEVFLEPAFPPDVHKILYLPHADRVSAKDATVMPTWQAVRDYFFDSCS